MGPSLCQTVQLEEPVHTIAMNPVHQHTSRSCPSKQPRIVSAKIMETMVLVCASMASVIAESYCPYCGTYLICINIIVCLSILFPQTEQNFPRNSQMQKSYKQLHIGQWQYASADLITDSAQCCHQGVHGVRLRCHHRWLRCWWSRSCSARSWSRSEDGHLHWR